MLLIFNTVLAVLTSLLYKSYPLLVFSFDFAYLNPFLVGAEPSSSPYTLLGYSLIISIGALFVSRLLNKEHKEYSITLLSVVFTAGNFLIFIAPFTNTFDWSIKLFALAA